jgi:uncharacterized protein DUF4845
MRKQRGITLSGFLVWAVIAIIVALIGFKLLPPYMEFLSVQAQFKAIANDPEGRQGVRRVVEDLFQRRAAIENINVISGKDIQIAKEGDRVVLSAEYSQCVPLVLNIRVCMDFTPSSAAK